MRYLAVISLSLLLAACTNDVHRLHDLNPAANDFPSSLASEYQAYADSELEQGRFISAEHYASKGLRALKGENVEPDVADGSLPAQAQQDLADARAQLMKVLTDDVKRIAPQQAARSQLLFDCWQHELAKHIDQTNSPCGDEFHSTFQQLQDVSDPLIYGKMIHHTILFAAKTTKLDAQNQKAIKEIAASLVNVPHYRIQLDAYIGIKSSQRKLSEARIAAVHKALVKAGIAERRIHTRKARSAKAVVLSGDAVAHDTKKVNITIKISGPSKESHG